VGEEGCEDAHGGGRVGSQDVGNVEGRYPGPRNRRSGEAKGSSVEEGLEKRDLMLTPRPSSLDTDEEGVADGYRVSIASGEKSKIESVVTRADG
jgi:hypothetical protein